MKNFVEWYCNGNYQTIISLHQHNADANHNPEQIMINSTIAADIANDKFFAIRCKAFRGESIKRNSVCVTPDGKVRAYDSVAGHYTTLHSMSRAAVAKARKMAGF